MSFVRVTLRLSLLVGGSVSLVGHQRGSLAVHHALGGTPDDPQVGPGWSVTHVATGCKLPLEPLQTRAQAEALVEALLADSVLWRTFSATAREAVETTAPPDIHARLDGMRDRVCAKL